MAIINKRIIGTPTGKIGNIVYRNINGKVFASSRPDKYNASQSKAAKSNRNRFRTVIAFCKYVNSIPELKSIWKVAQVNSFTSFNKLVKLNIHHVSESNLSLKNIITPPTAPHQIYFYVKEFSLTDKKINFSFSLSNSLPFPPNARLYLITASFNPKRKNYKSFDFFHNIVELEDIKNSKVIDIKIQHLTGQKMVLHKYKMCICYAAIVFESSQPKKAIFTETISKKFYLTEII